MTVIDINTEKPDRRSCERAAAVPEIVEYLSDVMRGEACDDDDKKLSIKDRMKAAELLGKHYGMFSDKGGPEEVAPVIIGGGDELEE